MMSEKIQEVTSLDAYSHGTGSFTRRKLSFKLDTQAHDGFMKWLRNMDHTMKTCHREAHKILYDNTEALTRHWFESLGKKSPRDTLEEKLSRELLATDATVGSSEEQEQTATPSESSDQTPEQKRAQDQVSMEEKKKFLHKLVVLSEHVSSFAVWAILDTIPLEAKSLLDTVPQEAHLYVNKLKSVYGVENLMSLTNRIRAMSGRRLRSTSDMKKHMVEFQEDFAYLDRLGHILPEEFKTAMVLSSVTGVAEAKSMVDTTVPREVANFDRGVR